MPILFPEEAKSVLEALCFVSNEPLSSKTMAEITGIDEREINYLLKEIKADLEKEQRGFTLLEMAGGYIFATRPEHALYIERLIKPQLSTLSQAAMETLAIIAYKQPKIGRASCRERV